MLRERFIPEEHWVSTLWVAEFTSSLPFQQYSEAGDGCWRQQQVEKGEQAGEVDRACTCVLGFIGSC